MKKTQSNPVWIDKKLTKEETLVIGELYCRREEEVLKENVFCLNYKVLKYFVTCRNNLALTTRGLAEAAGVSLMTLDRNIQVLSCWGYIEKSQKLNKYVFKMKPNSKDL